MSESFTDPNTGVRMRRNWLGAVNFGKLVLRANDKGWDLYWAGKGGHPLAACDRNLRNRVNPKRLSDSIFWLCPLPQGHYHVAPDRLNVGYELFEIHRPLPLPAEDKPMPPPSPIGIAAMPRRQPIFISRPTV
jgi:hypothetical protein